MDKYQESFELLNKAVEAKNNVDNCHDCLDSLLDYIKLNFEQPPKDLDTLPKTFKSLNVPDGIYEKELKENHYFFGEHLYPIFLVRFGIHPKGKNLPITPSRLRNFGWFHKTYGPIIFAGMTS